MVKTRKHDYSLCKTEDTSSPSSSTPASQSSSNPPACSSSPDWSILSCCICQEFPRFSDPQSVVSGCRNGHLVCTRCSNLMTNNRCPSCRTTVDMSFPSSLIRRLMMSSSGVSVSCFYGCELTGSMDAIVDHERSCKLKLDIVNCRFQLCMEKVRLEMLDSHMEECSYRPIMCPLCQHFIQPSEWMSAHFGCFSENSAIIYFSENTDTSRILISKYVLIRGNDGSNQAFAVISAFPNGLLMEVEVYGLEPLEIEQFTAEIIITGHNEPKVVTKALLSWEEFLNRRFTTSRRYGWTLRASSYGIFVVKVALNQINQYLTTTQESWCRVL